MQKGAKAFISHASADAVIAKFLGNQIESDFLEVVRPFVSSRPNDNKPGRAWFTTITTELMSANIVIVITNRTSQDRPWINFESGAGFGRDIPVVPICCGGLRPEEIAGPLGAFQALHMSNLDDLRTLYQVIAQIADMSAPPIDYGLLAQRLQELDIEPENLAPGIDVPKQVMTRLQRHLHDFIEKVASGGEEGRIVFEALNATQLQLVTGDLQELKVLGLLDFDNQLSYILISDGGGKAARRNSPLHSSSDGMFYDLRIDASDELIAIAKSIHV